MKTKVAIYMQELTPDIFHTTNPDLKLAPQSTGVRKKMNC